jgi:endonuclease IV
MHLLGSHCPDTGGVAMAVARAAGAGMQALQLFTAVPKYYNEKVGVKPERVARFREALAASGTLRAEHVMAHAAYVLNVATPTRPSGSARRPASRRSSSARVRWDSGCSASTPARPPTGIAMRPWRA